MKTLQNLLFAFVFLALAPAMHAAEKEGEGHGKKHGEFYPTKPADKAMATRPSVVELIEPKALSTVSGNQVTLQWKPVETATSYRLQVATDPNFKWLLVQHDFLKDTKFNLTDLQAGQKYYWRVYAWKENNDPLWMSSYSNMSSFEVK